MRRRPGFAEIHQKFESAPVAQLGAPPPFNRAIRRRVEHAEQQPHLLLAEDLDKPDLLFAFDANTQPIQFRADAVRAENEAVDRDPQLLRAMFPDFFQTAARPAHKITARTRSRAIATRLIASAFLTWILAQHVRRATVGQLRKPEQPVDLIKTRLAAHNMPKQRRLQPVGVVGAVKLPQSRGLQAFTLP